MLPITWCDAAQAVAHLGWSCPAALFCICKTRAKRISRTHAHASGKHTSMAITMPTMQVYTCCPALRPLHRLQTCVWARSVPAHPRYLCMLVGMEAARKCRLQDVNTFLVLNAVCLSLEVVSGIGVSIASSPLISMEA